MSEPRVVFVGKKPSYAYVKAVVMAMDEGHRHIKLQARGSAISRAVDVAEICRRRHGITASRLPLSITIDSIETSSVELKGDDDRMKTVSSIAIDIIGEGDMVDEEE
ncbi:MAG: RNA-binding protein [Euryarchaeota archaeon]|nr:RNA-binding protein [Euryarchaeota archaeon]MAS49430.1 RNA-binding protein [Euryarchaeota archaeon]MBD38533.1 RNA-binding protein [Euryarchaeota archaeon]RPG78343.1 MAG: RNA-binding protein [Euryarchaeota archaeon TMED117]|tara:strand:+ start:2555 stop:2875 length:321 start_codon:yes stop_codon:yes gene_type:complete